MTAKPEMLCHKETSRVEFMEYGTPLPFERTKIYRRLKKNRLTVEMIEEYLFRHFII